MSVLSTLDYISSKVYGSHYITYILSTNQKVQDELEAQCKQDRSPLKYIYVTQSRKRYCTAIATTGLPYIS